MRENKRLNIQLSSSIKRADETKRNFCIIRNISKKGVFLTARLNLSIGEIVECIMSFEGQSIVFTGKVRRIDEDSELGTWGYGIEIMGISEQHARDLEEFVDAGYLPEMYNG